MKTSAEVYNKYLKEYVIDDENLEKLKTLIIEMLHFLHKVCVENDIKYSMAYGTLLGAIRHGGFIPWDDDADLIITREDYEKLKKIVNEKYSDEYEIIDNKVNKKYNLYFAKFVKKNTKLVEVQNEQRGNGKVYIDLFILENTPRNEKLKQIKRKGFLFFNRLASLSSDYKFPSPTLLAKAKEFPELRKYYKKRRTFGFFASILPSSVWVFLAEKCSMSKRKSSKSYWTGIRLKEIAEEDYNDLVLYDFSGIELYGMRNYDKYLTKEYGDYMKMPAIDKREKHIIIKLNLNSED